MTFFITKAWVLGQTLWGTTFSHWRTLIQRGAKDLSILSIWVEKWRSFPRKNEDIHCSAGPRHRRLAVKSSSSSKLCTHWSGMYLQLCLTFTYGGIFNSLQVCRHLAPKMTKLAEKILQSVFCKWEFSKSLKLENGVKNPEIWIIVQQFVCWCPSRAIWVISEWQLKDSFFTALAIILKLMMCLLLHGTSVEMEQKSCHLK